MASHPKEMAFLDHLEEMRWRLIKCIAAIAVFSIGGWIYWRNIFDLAIVYPLHLANPRPKLIFTAPAEAVVLSMKIAVAAGIVCATPVIFYQLWKFIGPGLYKGEKRIVIPAMIASTICFLLGASFAYAMLPYLIKLLSGYSHGALEPFFKADDYMTFIIQIVLAFGAVFELPVLSFVLTKMGVLTPKFLIDKGRYAIVIIFVIAAIITPPDVLSQIVLAVPLIALYGISILVSFAAQEKKK